MPKRKSRSPSPSRSNSKSEDQRLPKLKVLKTNYAGADTNSSPYFSSTPSINCFKSIITKTSKSAEEAESEHKQPTKLWTNFQRENLNLDYTILYDRKKASEILARCESEIVYNVGKMAQVRICGKWFDIRRKQVAFGDSGLTYSFSGKTVPAKPWTPLLLEMKNDVSKMCGYDFNFVLVNRYQDGNDYVGEHKDDEKDLCPGHPIASLSLGQQRDFFFRHQDCRGKNAKRKIDKLTILLETGCLLMMKAPTNSFWYHCLPKRPRVSGMRLNFTFRKMVHSLCKPVKNSEDNN